MEFLLVSCWKVAWLWLCIGEIPRDLNDTINNPLSIISVSTDSLREKFSNDTEVADYLGRIEAAMKRIREVIGV